MMVIGDGESMVMTRYGDQRVEFCDAAASRQRFGHSLLAFRSVGNARLCGKCGRACRHCDGRQNSAMKTIYNAVHAAHRAEYEFFRGEKSRHLRSQNVPTGCTLLCNARAWRGAVAAGARRRSDPQSPSEPTSAFCVVRTMSFWPWRQGLAFPAVGNSRHAL